MLLKRKGHGISKSVDSPHSHSGTERITITTVTRNSEPYIITTQGSTNDSFPPSLLFDQERTIIFGLVKFK